MMNRNTNRPVQNQNSVHAFESAGLGRGPFRLQRVTEEGGHCEFCSTPIKYRFYLLGSDAREFFVGSDCVLRSGDTGLIPVVRAEVNRRNAEARRARENRGVIGVRAKLADSVTRAELARRPHPNAFYASQGKTFADYLDFCAQHAGKTKLAQLDRQAEEMLSV